MHRWASATWPQYGLRKSRTSRRASASVPCASPSLRMLAAAPSNRPLSSLTLLSTGGFYRRRASVPTPRPRRPEPRVGAVSGGVALLLVVGDGGQREAEDGAAAGVR